MSYKADLFSQKKFNKIEVKYVLKNKSTFVSVKPSKFDSSFHPSQYYKIGITDTSILNRLSADYQTLQITNTNTTIDVRIKLFLYQSNSHRRIKFYANDFNDIFLNSRLVGACKLREDIEGIINSLKR